jgi:type I restriction enzyme S subunit
MQSELRHYNIGGVVGMSFESAGIKNHVSKIKTWNPVTEIPDESFSYIDLSSVDKDAKKIDDQKVPILLGKEAPSRARQIVESSDVLVSTVRPNLNGVALLNGDYRYGTASTGYCILRTKPSLSSKYLFYWVQTKTFVADMVKKATGANYPAVSDRIIKDSKIPLPHLPRSKRLRRSWMRPTRCASSTNNSSINTMPSLNPSS